MEDCIPSGGCSHLPLYLQQLEDQCWCPCGWPVLRWLAADWPWRRKIYTEIQVAFQKITRCGDFMLNICMMMWASLRFCLQDEKTQHWFTSDNQQMVESLRDGSLPSPCLLLTILVCNNSLHNTDKHIGSLLVILKFINNIPPRRTGTERRQVLPSTGEEE